MSVLDLKELEDSTLMAWVVEGRHGALEVLYDRYADLVYSFALRMLGDASAARDLVLQVYLHVWQEARTFEPYRGSFVRWLLSQTHQLGIAEVRRKRAQAPGGPDATAGRALTADPGPDLVLVDALNLDDAIAYRRKRINDALALLSAEQRRAVELAYFEGYTQEEIGEVTGEPQAAIRSRIRLSLRKLREVLHPEDVEVGPA